MLKSSVGEPALTGGPRSVPEDHADLFRWPMVTEEDEQAVLRVLREGGMSGIEVTRQFESRWGEYQGTRYNLGHCNGTASLLAAMFAVGLGRGDELIAPSLTYWASASQVMALGATPVFADIDADTLCIDPADIEHRITPRTGAIMVVHYCGHPADMDAILAIARRHHLKVIEDVSHAHGALYKGRRVGSLGDVAAMSMMTGKSFAIGEGGMLCTNDRLIYERAVAFGHYERCKSDLTDPDLRRSVAPDEVPHGLPLGGVKHRMNQLASAMGCVQLKEYESRIGEIQRAMNRFWDLLEGTPGLRPHRVKPGSGDTMGGWYNPVGHYVPEEMGGLPVATFIEAVAAEGGRSCRGVNFPLHLHPVLNRADVYHDGRPTRIAFSAADVRQPAGSLPVSEHLAQRTFGIPWFKKDDPRRIALYAAAYRKIAQQYESLLSHRA